jgi:hypothetical protein
VASLQKKVRELVFPTLGRLIQKKKVKQGNNKTHECNVYKLLSTTEEGYELPKKRNNKKKAMEVECHRAMEVECRQ